MRYLLEDFSKDKINPKMSIISEREMFILLQDKTEGIAITKLPNECVIDWS